MIAGVWQHQATSCRCLIVAPEQAERHVPVSAAKPHLRAHLSKDH
jgi:hypothetical protein